MTADDYKCPICFSECHGGAGSRFSQAKLDCLRCGRFTITYEASVNIKSSRSEYGQGTTRSRANLSGWVREREGVLLDQNLCAELVDLATPSFHERAEKLMLAIEKQTAHAGQCVSLIADDGLGWAWCLNHEELKEIGDFLLETKRLRLTETETTQLRGFTAVLDHVVVTPEGWAYLETLREANPDSRQAFVAMSFDDDLREVEEAISGAVRDAGYTPHVERNREHMERVDDEVVRQIRRSRFVVVDFTGQSPNVYYEAGFARGLGLPVVWSCSKEEVDQDKVHFDVRQYNHIAWKTPEELRAELARRIEANLGRGRRST